MSDIRIHREHSLGLKKAREIAWQWAEEVEQKFDMECTVLEGEFSDTVEFTRSGVHGTLTVAADHFDLQARLGFLLGASAGDVEGKRPGFTDMVGRAKWDAWNALAGTERNDAMQQYVDLIDELKG